MRNLLLSVSTLLIAAAGGTARADSVTIVADRDNTIFSESDALSNGAGEYLFTSRIRGEDVRRALLRFPVQTALPVGATPTSATLTLFCSRTITGDTTVTLHRLNADWGEGTSDALSQEGGGAAAEPGDATWGFRFYDTDAWTTSGGDFETAPSATSTVGFAGAAYSWTSAQMLADVQGWLADPATNFGWIVIGDETVSASAKRFGSRENTDPAQRPLLTIEFEAAPPCVGDLDGSNTVDITDLAILLSGFGGPGGPGDLDGDGDIDIADLATLLSNFGVSC